MTDRKPFQEKRAMQNGRPAGTTDWVGSITERGTHMQDYYGRNIVKEPTWSPEIPVYFFTGGLAGASAVLHGIARLSGNHTLARRSMAIGAVADVLNPMLLIKDLGRPERFLHMLRMFKVTSPMSVGSWILFAQSGSAITASLLEWLDVLKPLKVAGEVVSFVAGPPLATYTGALVANTAIPVWSEARDELPWLFASSAAASAGAAAAVFTPTEAAGPARRTAIAGVVAELGLTQVMERKLGFVGEVYKQGEAGKFNKITKACTIAGAGVLALGGRKSRAAAVAGGALVLAGEMALRWSVFKAGFQSARDPRYTVIPQKQRKEARRGN
ncbi:MAG TPA: NrfD/PsrC family molybdoenzyme membrane anchor subunit [Gaiellaceae bacterium]